MAMKRLTRKMDNGKERNSTRKGFEKVLKLRAVLELYTYQQYKSVSTQISYDSKSC